jgi:TonB family protein
LEISLNGREKVNAQMKDDLTQLSEVVVTGASSDNDDRSVSEKKLAEPTGGRKAYDSYLESNLKYPEEALKNKIKGKAGIEFKVGRDGRLSDFRVTKKLGYGCEEEIIRLVKAGPKWSPTTEEGRPIESIVKVRLRFDPAKAGR